jgi:hypothetical protein
MVLQSGQVLAQLKAIDGDATWNVSKGGKMLLMIHHVPHLPLPHSMNFYKSHLFQGLLHLLLHHVILSLFML